VCYFSSLLRKGCTGTIIFLSFGQGLITLPNLSGYSINKLSDLELASYAATENESIETVAFHPGIINTNMATDSWKP
jgi:hypothetical protein